MKTLLASLLVLTSINAFAETDLSIEAPRWASKFDGYICQAFGPKVVSPKAHSNLNVKFESVVTDYTLDNGLLKASFNVNGEVCRYSAILLANNDTAKITLVDSKAYSTTEGVDCSAGKAVLDEQLAPSNDYLYYGHPHNVAIMVESSDAKEICGENATHYGINFVLSGRIQ